MDKEKIIFKYFKQRIQTSCFEFKLEVDVISKPLLVDHTYQIMALTMIEILYLTLFLLFLVA